MSRHTSRFDRVAQMTVQEEIIAKKKLELIEKQKTVELAKQVVAAQAQAGNTKVKKEKSQANVNKANATVIDPPPAKNFFSNDGSFFENFKKITEAVRKTQPDALPKALIETPKEAKPADIPETSNDINTVLDVNIDAAVLCAQPPPPPPPPLPEESNEIITVTPPTAIQSNVPIIASTETELTRPTPTTKIIPSLMDTMILPPPDFNNPTSNRPSSNPDNGTIVQENISDGSNFQTQFNQQNTKPFVTMNQGSFQKDATPIDIPISGNQFDGDKNSDQCQYRSNNRFNQDNSGSFSSNQFTQDQSFRSANRQNMQNRSNTNQFNGPPNRFQQKQFANNVPNNRGTDQNSNFSNRFGSGPTNFSNNIVPADQSHVPNSFKQDQSDYVNRFPNEHSKFQQDSSTRFQQQNQSNRSDSNQSYKFHQNQPSRFPQQQQQPEQLNNRFNQNRFAPTNQQPSSVFQPDNNSLNEDQNSSNKFLSDNGNQFQNKNTSNQSQITFPQPQQNYPQPQQNNSENPFQTNTTTTKPPFQNSSGLSIGSSNIFNDIDERILPADPTYSSNIFKEKPVFGRSLFDMDDKERQSLTNSNDQTEFNKSTLFTNNQSNQDLFVGHRFQQPPPQPIPSPNINLDYQKPFNLQSSSAPFSTSTLPLLQRSSLTLNSVEQINPCGGVQPLQYPPLHTIPPPMPLSLNKIPPPKDLDLNAIPEPKLNLDAIQIPEFSYNRVFSDNEFIPSSVESLVEMVAENGDDYEEKLLSRKCDIHSSLWFLTDKSSLEYRNYRERVLEYRHQKNNMKKPNNNDDDKYDPEEIYNDYKDDEDNDDDNDNENRRHYSPKRTDDYIESEPDYDSDTSHKAETKKRNTDNIKRKLTTQLSYYSSDSEDMEMEAQKIQQSIDDEQSDIKPNKKKRSRWGEKVESSTLQPLMSLTLPPVVSLPRNAAVNSQRPMFTSITRNDPALQQYARQNYGSTNLSEDDWKKCEDHYKISLLYQDMVKKRNEIDRLAKAGRFKYEYDSDEDINGGTWEHKLRTAEMEATAVWAEALNKQSEGKHHIGDFLPPEELKKFMQKYNTKQMNREPDLSDYKEYKLREDNIGFQMLQKLGWKEGQGLGSGGTGIVNPINSGQQRDSNQGLGTMENESEYADNEYDAYRKRMMLAYRFRPNPLNNPRRAYY